jgi:hypothetical protein
LTSQAEDAPAIASLDAQLPLVPLPSLTPKACTTMAKGKSWFVGFVKKPADSTTSTATPSGERVEGNKRMNWLANKMRAGANIGGIDAEEERDAPPRVLAPVFPKTTKTIPVQWSSDHPPPDFQRLFASIQGPEAVLTGHLLALNCDHQPRRPGDALLPPREDGTSYVPSKTSEEDKQFAERIAELDITNDAAFRAINKTTKPGDKKPRLTNMRRFWISLENMAQYWDTSADQYYFVNVPDAPEKPGLEHQTKAVRRYKGRRTASGRDMPDIYRANTVNDFVAGIISAFNCRVGPAYVAPGRFAPTMQIGKLEQPVRLTSVVLRIPNARDKQRAGFLEGPVMGVLERNTIDFGSTAGFDVSWRKSDHDLLKEIGAMLIIAQQRAREGRPTMQDEDKWYMTKPRWGGGPGGKLPHLDQAEEEYEDLIMRMATTEAEKIDLDAQKLSAGRKLQRAQAFAKNWTTMPKTPTPSLWHAKTDYQAIGKPPGSPYDDVSSIAYYPESGLELTNMLQVFLVSCIYHHVSILRLTIHDAYTHYLTTGVMPEQTPAEEDWCSPRLERTEWYDLLDQEGRVDAFRCIWGVMEYVNQDLTTGRSDTVSNGDQTRA